MPGLLAGLEVEDLGAEAVALGPAQVHAQQHLGPVAGVGAAGAGVDRDDGVARRRARRRAGAQLGARRARASRLRRASRPPRRASRRRRPRRRARAGPRRPRRASARRSKSASSRSTPRFSRSSFSARSRSSQRSGRRRLALELVERARAGAGSSKTPPELVEARAQRAQRARASSLGVGSLEAVALAHAPAPPAARRRAPRSASDRRRPSTPGEDVAVAHVEGGASPGADAASRPPPGSRARRSASGSGPVPRASMIAETPVFAARAVHTPALRRAQRGHRQELVRRTGAPVPGVVRDREQHLAPRPRAKRRIRSGKSSS